MSKLSEYNDLIQQMEEMLESLKSMLETKLNSQGFELEKTIERLHLDSEEIVKESIEEIKVNNAKVAGWWSLVHTEADPTKEHQDVEEARKILVDILTDIAEYLHFETELRDMKEEFEKEKESFLNQLSSPEYEQNRLDKIERLKNTLEHTTNLAKRKQIKHDIKVTEEEYSLGFLFAELENSDRHATVVKRSMDAFFDNKKSAYALEKFKQKCMQLKINPRIYRSILNLEEKFLEEKYHVFNNFFLFNCIQYIAHADSVRNEKESKTVLQAMLKLVNGKFANEDVKDIFLEAMRRYLNQFEEFRAVFEEKNILHPGHPHRIASEKQREIEFREVIFREIMQRNWATEEEIAQMQSLSLVELNAFCKRKEEEQKALEEQLANQIDEELDKEDEYEDEEEEPEGTGEDENTPAEVQKQDDSITFTDECHKVEEKPTDSQSPVEETE